VVTVYKRHVPFNNMPQVTHSIMELNSAVMDRGSTGSRGSIDPPLFGVGVKE